MHNSASTITMSERPRKQRAFFLLENGLLGYKILKILRCAAYVWAAPCRKQEDPLFSLREAGRKYDPSNSTGCTAGPPRAGVWSPPSMVLGDSLEGGAGVLSSGGSLALSSLKKSIRSSGLAGAYILATSLSIPS